MENNSKALSLRIFVSSTDKFKSGLLYESIILRAREAGIAGATAYKGIFGFGASSVIQSFKFWEVSDKLPVVIELIDEENKIMSFHESILPELMEMRYGCLVITQEVDVKLFKSGHKK